MALDSEPDLNAGLEHLTANARAIGKAIKDPAERDRVANIVKTRAYADFAKYGPAIGYGVIVNNWARPCVVGNYGVDYIARALTTYGGIWANVMPEVLYYRASTDGSGTQLSGDIRLPSQRNSCRSHSLNTWSVIAVDTKHFRVLPNPKNRYLINRETHPQYNSDGSLTLYFSAGKPANAPDGNWLPTPKGSVYRLTFRFYGPIDGVANGTYYPPAMVKVSN